MTMEYKPEDASRSWFSPAALASWLTRFCSGSNSDDHDELAGDGDNRSAAQMAGAAARYLTYSPHKIKFA
ncbi:unnamed protein product [Urochloa decumbens]|uniref:Uncharacterized protein n=1 Tax=Urochloa decumbens TaxID=240449 RepID=A0ABC9ECD4_9POAL